MATDACRSFDRLRRPAALGGGFNRSPQRVGCGHQGEKVLTKRLDRLHERKNTMQKWSSFSRSISLVVKLTSKHARILLSLCLIQYILVKHQPTGHAGQMRRDAQIQRHHRLDEVYGCFRHLWSSRATALIGQVRSSIFDGVRFGCMSDSGGPRGVIGAQDAAIQGVREAGRVLILPKEPRWTFNAGKHRSNCAQST